MGEQEIKIPLLKQQEDENTEEEEEAIEEKAKQGVVYKRRWFILFIFSMNTMVSGVLFMGLSSISNIAARYYNQSEVLIEWLSNSFVLFYSIFALPVCYFIFKYGVRATLTTVAAFDAIATFLHYFGYENNNFWCVAAGQAFAALAYSGILQIPGQLSAKWFPENERATATSIGVFMNIFGVAIGSLHPTLHVRDEFNTNGIKEGLQCLFLMQLCFTVLIFVLTTFGYRENPPSPPSTITVPPKMSFKEDLKALFRNKNFMFMSQSYGLYCGLMVTFMVILDSLVTHIYPTGHASKIGWMGFTSYMASILSMFLIGLWLDKFKRHQLMSVLLTISSTIIWLLFVLTLTLTSNFTITFAMYVILGAVAIPYFSSGIEQAAEMTYPVPEVVSSTVILIFANFYGFLLILVMGYLVGLGHVQTVGFMMFTCYALSTLFSCLATTRLKRQEAEEEASVDNSDGR